MQTNRMKEKLAAGDPAFGLSVMIPSPQIVESAAGMVCDGTSADAVSRRANGSSSRMSLAVSTSFAPSRISLWQPFENGE